MSQVEMAMKLKSGFGLLAGRSVLTKVLQVLSSLVLAYKLVPADYGTFGIIYGFLASLIFFTDIGLSDVLIQKKQAITDEEFSTYIGIRLLLGFFCMLFFVFIYPLIVKHYSLNFEYSFLVGVMAVILPMEAFIGATLVHVQKNLQFKELARIELLETSLLYIVQITLAFLNFGIWSLFIAIVCSRFFKTIYCIHALHIKIRPTLNFSLFKPYYKNGFYFQLNSIIPTSKAMLLPLVLALFLDIHTIGIIFWISSLVSLPMVLVYNYNSVMFPALSKIQDNIAPAKELASRSMEKIFLLLAVVFGLGGLLGDQIITILFNKNWSDAKQLVFYCALYHFVYAVRYTSYPVLYAKNLARKRTLGELLMVLAEYVCAYIFCRQYGAYGYYLSLIVINVSAFYYFSYYGKDWLRDEVYKRFHLTFVFLCATLIVERSLNWNLNPFFSMSIEFVVFLVMFLICFSAFDRDFRTLLSKFKTRIINYV